MKRETGSSALATLIELATGRAHRVHPGDVTRSLGERFAGETLLLVMLAREKAATVRIGFEADGQARIGETRQVAGRGQGELARVLQAEARATGARWGLAVFALGWQAVLGTRALRPGPEGRPFDRFRLALEQPELLCAQPQADALYTGVDHPTLDRSVVFSLRRREVEDVLQDFRAAGLDVAGVRIGVAAQLEAWLAARGPAAVEHDLLVSDSLSVLLLQVEHGEFRAPTGAAAGMDARPRQASARPNETSADMIRFLRDQARGAVCFLGANELTAVVQAGIAETAIELARAPEGSWQDAVSAVLAPDVRHDLNPDLREERGPLAAAWRKYILAGLATAAVLLAIIGVNLWQIVRAEWDQQEAVATAARQQQRREHADQALAGLQQERQLAERIRWWAAHNYHAQPLAHNLLRTLPADVGLERLSAHLEESSAQMTLEFTLLGDEAAQVAATRALERAVMERALQIGERHPITPTTRGALHRWRLLLPAGTWEEERGSGPARGTAAGELLWAGDLPARAGRRGTEEGRDPRPARKS